MNKKYVRQKILNYYINPINTQTLKEVIIDWIKNKKKSYICISAVHGAVESVENKKYKLHMTNQVYLWLMEDQFIGH